MSSNFDLAGWDKRLTIVENRMVDRYGLLLSLCEKVLSDNSYRTVQDRSSYALCRRMLLVMVELGLYKDQERWWREIRAVEKILKL